MGPSHLKMNGNEMNDHLDHPKYQFNPLIINIHTNEPSK